MEAVPRRPVRLVACSYLAVALVVGEAHAQAPPDPDLPPLPGASAPTRSSEAPRLAQLPPDASTPSPSLPAAEGDIRFDLPAAMDPLAAGTPTAAAETGEAETAEAAPEVKTPLADFLGIPAESPFKIFGWIQNSFTGNPSNPADRINFGVTPNYRANDWLGNQYYTVFEKTLQREGRIDIGGRFDFLFGHDHAFTKMRGVFDNAWPATHFPGIDLPQFYGEIHLPWLTEGGLDVRFGRWYTLHGYEVVPAISRPLLSVDYMFTFGQPFTHWGAMTTWNVSDQLIIYNGVPQGWDLFQNERAKWGYMGGFSWTSRDSKFNLTSIYSYAPDQYVKQFLLIDDTFSPTLTPNEFFTNESNQLWSTVVSYKWTDRLTQVLETDHGWERGVPVISPNGRGRINSSYHSFGNWFLYQFDEQAKVTGVWRSEVFWDDQGTRTGFADRFYEMTLGMILKPHPNLWVRPEARYDWSQFTTPYDAGTQGSQITLGIDAILLY